MTALLNTHIHATARDGRERTTMATTETIEILKHLVRCAREDTAVLDVESMKFFKAWLVEDLKATIPPPKAPPPSVNMDDPELMTPDSDVAHTMGPEQPKETLSDDEEAKMIAAKEAAAEAVAAEKYDEAIEKYTEAVVIAPSALTYAKRAECFIKLRKPNAAIRDCDAALKINPDSAKALKIRGAAQRYLGQYAAANADLSKGLQIDFDEHYGDIHKAVLSRVHEMHVAEGKARAQKEAEAKAKAAEARARAAADAANAANAAGSGMPSGGMPGGGMPGGMPNVPPEMLEKLTSDPELMKAMQNPKVMQAMQAMMSNPMAAMQYMSDPEVGPVLQKLMGLFGGGMPGGMGGMGGMPGGMGGMPGGFGGGAPPSANDVD